MKHDDRPVSGKKGSASICILLVLPIHASLKPSELSNVTPLPRNKFSIKSLKRFSRRIYLESRSEKTSG